MNNMYAILIAAHFGAGEQEALGAWHIWWTISSGWTAPSGIYVDSTGRNVAYGDFSDPRLFVDRRLGKPLQVCDTQPLSDHQIRKLAFRLARIPPDVLEKRVLSLDGPCADEMREGVTLNMHGRDFYFGYSLESHCRNGKAVPDWLSSLVKALQIRYHEIKSCAVTSSSEEPTP